MSHKDIKDVCGNGKIFRKDVGMWSIRVIPQISAKNICCGKGLFSDTNFLVVAGPSPTSGRKDVSVVVEELVVNISDDPNETIEKDLEKNAFDYASSAEMIYAGVEEHINIINNVTVFKTKVKNEFQNLLLASFKGENKYAFLNLNEGYICKRYFSNEDEAVRCLKEWKEKEIISEFKRCNRIRIYD